MNPFTMFIDWVEDYPAAGLISAFTAVALCVVLGISLSQLLVVLQIPCKIAQAVFCQVDTLIEMVIVIYDHTNVTPITCDTPHNVRIDTILGLLFVRPPCYTYSIRKNEVKKSSMKGGHYDYTKHTM